MSYIVDMLLAYLIFSLSTIVVDIIHYLQHSKFKKHLMSFLKNHYHHHKFFNRNLKIDLSFHQQNTRYHTLVELFFLLLCASISCFFVNILTSLILFFIIAAKGYFVISKQGLDNHHQTIEQWSPPKSSVFVNKMYHAQHHLHPNYCYSSYVKLLDYILGTCTPLAYKKVAITGAGGAFGSAICLLLKKERVKQITTIKYLRDYTYNNYSDVGNLLKNIDILILCHGSFEQMHQANYLSYKQIINIYLNLPLAQHKAHEIWAVGSEIELHAARSTMYKTYKRSKMLYANFAKSLYHNPRIIYRHIVPSAFRSNSTSIGLMSASFCAKLALFFIKRDWRYIPVSYTGIAWVNFFFFTRPKKKNYL